MSEIALGKHNAPARLGGGDTLKAAAAVLVLAALASLPAYANDYQLFIANLIVVYSLVSVGFNIVIGYLGQLAFANAAFFGIGAYATGLLMVHLSAPFAVALAGGALAGAIGGALVTLPALRVSGYYLLIVTFSFSEVMRWVYAHGGAVTFGSGGFDVPKASVAGFPLDSEQRKYFAFLAVALIGIVLTRRLLVSRFGRAFAAVRTNERTAAMAGIGIARTKLIAFAWSGFIVGLAGGLYAVLNGRVTPESFGLGQMLLHFAIVVTGGLASLLGSVLGAVLLTAVPEVLRNLPGVEEIALSLILIAVLFFMPRGIAGALARLSPVFRERLYRGRSRA